MENIFRELRNKPVFRKKDCPDFPNHIHEDLELLYVKKGSGTAFCDGKSYRLTEGSFFLVFPNQVHRYTDFIPGTYIILILKPSVLYSYSDLFIESEPAESIVSYTDSKENKLSQLLEQALEEFSNHGYSPIVIALLTAFFGKLLRHYQLEKNPLSHDTVLKILQYCAKHYKESITVGEVSKKLHISRSYISHIFSSRLAMNFCEYINSLRLSDALFLLRSKRLSVTEISGLAGFSSIRTFNRSFIKHYGITPTEYRKRLENSEEWDSHGFSNETEPPH